MRRIKKIILKIITSNINKSDRWNLIRMRKIKKIIKTTYDIKKKLIKIYDVKYKKFPGDR